MSDSETGNAPDSQPDQTADPERATRPCPHCGDLLGERQIRRHRALRRDALALQLNPNPNIGLRNDQGLQPMALEAHEPAAAQFADEGANGGAGNVVEHPVRDNSDMSLDGRDDIFDPVPLRRNPPVTIQDWPDPDDDPPPSDVSDDGLPPEPEFVERGDAPLGEYPEDEAEMDDEELLRFLQENLGDLVDEEWLETLYDRDLADDEYDVLRFLATRIRTHFSRQIYEELRYGACAKLNIPSEEVAWRRLRILSGLELRSYDMCINSCCCFLGKHAAAQICPYCNSPRFNDAGKPRRSFRYTPLIPQLAALFQNPEMIAKLGYRQLADEQYEHGIVQDVFDSEHYRRLRETPINAAGYCPFSGPNDLALGVSTDGVSLFKWRRRGHSVATPIIVINYNLHPSHRMRLENVICVGVIPGPRQCKDLNSFLVPLVEELLELESGVRILKVVPQDDNNPTPDNETQAIYIVLYAFLIVVFGDIPAVSKMLMLKGHNAKCPCRTCYIQGELCRLARSSMYYVPLTRPGNPPVVLRPDQLIMRTHELFLAHYAALEAEPIDARRKRLAKAFGVNSRPVLARLKSIDLASCAPYDAMHLLFENLVPNMIRHWTGRFKGIDQGTGNYLIAEDDWAEIGRLTAKATKTIPSEFVGTLPDIAQDGNLYKAEAHAFWFQYVAPILLEDRLPNVYYEHFLLIRQIFIIALQFELTHDDLDELQDMINTWVVQYEEYYYQHEARRLPTCPLTIHALLHIPYYIRTTGPLWTSWAFVMERFCGHIVPAVKNRVRPYEHLDNYVQRRAQMQAVSLKYGLPSLAKPRINYNYAHGERFTSRERMYPEFNTIILGTPICYNVHVNTQLMNQMGKYFGQVYARDMGLNGAEIRARIDTDTLVSFGRFRLAGDGDRFRTAETISRNRDARDNSFVRYENLPDANAALPNAPDVPVRWVNYGQLLNLYYVEFITDVDNDVRKPFLLAQVKECNTEGADAALPENPLVVYNRMSTPDIIHLDTVTYVVGRIEIGRNTWAIIDRSTSGARTQFLDPHGEPEDFD